MKNSWLSQKISAKSFVIGSITTFQTIFTWCCFPFFTAKAVFEALRTFLVRVNSCWKQNMNSQKKTTLWQKSPRSDSASMFFFRKLLILDSNSCLFKDSSQGRQVSPTCNKKNREAFISPNFSFWQKRNSFTSKFFSALKTDTICSRHITYLVCLRDKTIAV